jgi:nitrogen PTS system EIIA component
VLVTLPRHGGKPMEARDTMQLTMREVSKLLNVPDATVVRWIKQRGLPASYVGGQYRFHRAELLEWATGNQIKVAAELFDRKESEPVPSIVAALEAGGVFHGLPCSDKSGALRALVDVLPLPEETDRALLLQLLLAREASASTAIGDGIALPHVRNPIVLNVAQPMISVCFLAQPIDFGAIDGRPVHVLFALVSPTVHTHLQLLARLSFALHDAKFRAVVLRQGARDAIVQEARRIEAAMPTPVAAGQGTA